MSEEPVEIGQFSLQIFLFKYSDGQLQYRTKSSNHGVQREVAIMNIKAVLKHIENEFYDAFDQSTVEFKKD